MIEDSGPSDFYTKSFDEEGTSSVPATRTLIYREVLIFKEATQSDSAREERKIH